MLSCGICRAHRILRDLPNRLGLGNGRKREPLLLTGREVRQGHVFGRIYTRSPCVTRQSGGSSHLWQDLSDAQDRNRNRDRKRNPDPDPDPGHGASQST